MVGSFIREVQTICALFLFPPVHFPIWDEDQVAISYLEARWPRDMRQPVPVSTTTFFAGTPKSNLVLTITVLPPFNFLSLSFPLIFQCVSQMDVGASGFIFVRFELYHLSDV
jgi:hypothetical protein